MRYIIEEVKNCSNCPYCEPIPKMGVSRCKKIAMILTSYPEIPDTCPLPPVNAWERRWAYYHKPYKAADHLALIVMDQGRTKRMAHYVAGDKKVIRVEIRLLPKVKP